METSNKNQEELKKDFIEENLKNPSKGLNDWNDRLDENLEPQDHNDVVADRKAKDFSEKLGSGDQSDQNNS